MKKNLKLIGVHTFYQLLETLRQPMYVLTTLVFPAMFFSFFGVPNAKDHTSAVFLMGSFSCFAILGVVFFQFAVGLAQDNATPWMDYLKIIPSPSILFFIPRVINSLILSVLAVFAVILITVSFTPIVLDEIAWGIFAVNLLLFSLPFAFLGASLGYAIDGKAILPIANMVYLPLSFAGGLWVPPNMLPNSVQKVSEYLPSRFYAEIVWGTLLNKSIPEKYIIGLFIYGLLFLGLGFLFFKRSRVKEFH